MNAQSPPRSQLLKIPDVARRLNVGRTMVYELIRKGEITPIHIGRSVRIDAAAVERLIETLAAEAEANRVPLAPDPWRRRQYRMLP